MHIFRTRLYPTILLLIIKCVAFSQTNNFLSSSSSTAQTYVSDKNQSATLGNPANIGYIKTTQISTYYQNRFLLPQLATKTVSVAIPFSEINLGTGISYFGYSQYHEILATIGAAKNFSNHFSLGLQAHYQSIYNPAIGSYLGTFLIQSGASINITKTFNLGISIFNPTQSNIKTQTTTTYLMSLFSTGFGWQLTPELEWRSQIDRELHKCYRIASGMDYNALKMLVLKIGAYYTDNFIPCMGIRLNTRSVAVDFDTEIHPQLGLNVICGLKFRMVNSSNSNLDTQ